MAVFYFSDAASLTADVMTNLYLYGKTETPVDLNDRIRARNGGSDQVKMDMEAFMRGPGRYALASNAYAVQILFGDSGNWFELNGKYTVGDLIAKKIFSEKDFLIHIQHYSVDPQSLDYLDRTYIYNTQAFLISKETVIVFEEGAPRIENLSIRARDDNFDLSSDSFSSKIGNLYLKGNIDPQDLGRRVEIEFRGQVALTELYDSASYEADVALWNSIYHPLLGYPEIASTVGPFVQHLKDDGIIEYNYKGKNITYLTVGDDIYYVNNVNGEVVVGGDGNDDLVGAEGIDYLLGGNGNDTFLGGAGDDFIDGGDGIDAFSSSDGGGVIKISVDHGIALPEIFRGVEEAPLILSFAVGAAMENDHLWNIEKIILGSSDQIVKIDGGINQTIRSLIIDGGDGNDAIDFSDFSKGIEGELLKTENVETLIGSQFSDNIVSSSASIIYGNDGDDTILGGSDHKNFIVGGRGMDILTAGDLGDTLDGNDGQASFDDYGRNVIPSAVYNGGAGADTFVISPSGDEVDTFGRKITYTVINGADSSDRLVLRTALTQGEDYSLAADSDHWRDGIEIKGGLSSFWREDGTVAYGSFTSYLETPKISEWDGREFVAGIDKTVVRPDLGNVQMDFAYLASGSLMINFAVGFDAYSMKQGIIEIKGYQPGDLGLQFQHVGSRMSGSDSAGSIQESWNIYNDEMSSLINSVNHVELLSPFPAGGRL